ncbi:unnamed protein product [Heterobilharzia americana]|nr:unnamed protein product [Heterobilharzia americana]
MEPAGSHGVWCLDDFQFIPFIWGSSQLIGNSQYDPTVIPNREVAEREKDKYLFFSCIAYIIRTLKYIVWYQSSTKWEKVNSGLIKMYKGEVLEKFPVVQHFLFGNLLPFDRVTNPVGNITDTLNSQRTCFPARTDTFNKPLSSSMTAQPSQQSEHP